LKFDRDLVEAHYNFGCLWMDQNKFADAKTEFTAYTLRRSNTPEGWIKLGMAQLRNGDLLLSEKSFSTAYSLDSNNAEALNGLGLARIARDRPEDAQKFFSHAVDAHPDFAPARLNLAVVEDQYLHDQKAALENYHAYLAMTPRPENWDAVNALVNVLEPPPKVATPPPPKETETAVAKPPVAKPSPSARTNAPVARTNSPAQMARVQPEPVIMGTPVTPDNSAASRTGRNLSPLHWLAPAPKTNSNPALLPPKPAPRPVVKAASPPTPPPVTFPRYSYQSPSKPRAGDHKAAASVFSEGHKYEQAQQYAEAMSSYQTAAAVDPGWFEAQYNYGVLAFRQRDFEHALAADEMALAIQPDSVDTRYNFALALKSAGYVLDAVNELKKILVAHPDDVRAHLALGNLYAQQLDDTTQARQHYSKVLALDPANPKAPYIQFWLSANPP
jgi:tetratricopeptide (TPR) repeat protein